MGDAAAGDEAGDSVVVVELDAAEAEALAEVREMLERPVVAASASGGALSLEALLHATGAPLRLVSDTSSGRRAVAERAIAAGEMLFTEEAVAIFLSRSSEPVYSLTLTPEEGASASDTGAALLCTLPPWARMRTLRDTLTLAPRYRGGRAEEAFALLAQLTALGSAAHAAWDAVPPLPPGTVDEEERAEAGGDEALLAVPPRAQLLLAVSQCNGFAAALPEEDSPWKRALLWPLLARLALPSDRDRLFDDARPLSQVAALFAVASLFNHACGAAANVSYSDCSWAEGAAFPTITLRATRAIAAGEEATIGYLSAAEPGGAGAEPAEPGGAEELSTAERRYRLLMTYRFACACALCTAEEPAAGVGDRDPLRGHFPCGRGPEGAAAYFARGGRYPARPPSKR